MYAYKFVSETSEVKDFIFFVENSYNQNEINRVLNEKLHKDVYIFFHDYVPEDGVPCYRVSTDYSFTDDFGYIKKIELDELEVTSEELNMSKEELIIRLVKLENIVKKLSSNQQINEKEQTDDVYEGQIFENKFNDFEQNDKLYKFIYKCLAKHYWFEFVEEIPYVSEKFRVIDVEKCGFKEGYIIDSNDYLKIQAAELWSRYHNYYVFDDEKNKHYEICKENSCNYYKKHSSLLTEFLCHLENSKRRKLI